MQFLTKNATSLPPRMSTPPIPMPLVSHSRLNVFSKPEICTIRAYVSFYLSTSKAFSCAGPQKNGTPFFVNSWRGATMMMNSITKH
jgi:hypothetical protein